jgi:hypothetical protein
MYNINLNNPKVQVNGVDDTSGVVSNLIYDQVAHTLTFNAAHFTTFTAVENNQTISESSTSSSSGANNFCHNSPPTLTPDLFQINTTTTTAKIFFTPLSDTNQYFISFSEKPNAEEHGAQVILTREGVQNFTINKLKPNTIYYIKVRGQNGCMPGSWSNIIKIKTSSKIYYKNSIISNKINPTIKKLTTIQSIDKPTPTPIIQNNKSPIIQQPTPSTSETKKKCFLWWCW